MPSQDLEKMAGDLQKLETSEIKRLYRKKRKFIGWMLDSKHTGVEIAKLVAVAFETGSEARRVRLRLLDMVVSNETL